MSRDRFVAAAQRSLDGDDSMEAAAALERVVLRDFADDDRLDDLLEVLSLYAPGLGRPYADVEQLRTVIREALALLA